MKKTQTLPLVNPKSSRLDQSDLSFKIRPTLRLKEKENLHSEKSLLSAKAKAFINKTKQFDSPELIFALNDSIRKEVKPSQSSLKRIRDHQSINKTIHHSPTQNMVSFQQKSGKIFDFPIARQSQGFYSLNKEREKAIELASWVEQKLHILHSKADGVTLQDILDYKQTVLSYGLGEIIQTVTRRCKQQGVTLKYIWDATFGLFQNLLNILTVELKQKNKEMLKAEEEMNNIYLKNIEKLKNTNKEHEKHLEMLYEKMAKVIRWNRKLKKERGKQDIEKRILAYQLEGHTSCLEEATHMLLTQSKQPNCLNLAKKIIYKLQRDKNMKLTKTLKRQAKEKVQGTAKEYVLSWLRRYSFEDEQKLKEAVNLTDDQKFELLQIEEEEEDNKKISIYDYFQNYEIGIQAKPQQISQSTQYQRQMIQARLVNVGIGTKKNFYTSTIAQTHPINMKMGENYDKTSFNKTSSKQIYSISSNQRRGSAMQQQQSKNYREAASRRTSEMSSTKLSSQNQGLLKLPKSGKNRFQKETDTYQNDFPDVQEEEQEENGSVFLDEESIRQNKSISQNYFPKSQITMKSFFQWEGENSKTDRLELSEDQRDISLDNVAVQTKRTKKRKSSYRGSQKDLKECNQNFDLLPLQKKTFEQVYRSELKDQLNHRRESLITNVVRRRSFMVNNLGSRINREMVGYLYKPGKALTFVFKNSFNIYGQKIQKIFKFLNKKNNIIINPYMAKNQQYAKNLFANIASTLKPVPLKNVPKNKNYVNLSVAGITKFTSKLLYDLLRRIKCQKQKLPIEADRAQFPLCVIMIDQMTNRYGLRQIAEKKLRDFMQKINAFVSVSDRVRLIHKLVGISPQDFKVGAEQLLIYMKCIVYFDISKTIPSFNVGKDKDFSIEKVKTNKQTVKEEIDNLLSQFFPDPLIAAEIKNKVEFQLESISSQSQMEVQRIAWILIEQFGKIKNKRFQEYSLFWRNCQGNFFANFYKTLQIYGVQSQKLFTILGEALKHADAIDDIYGKTMNELKFVGFCCKMNIPLFSKIKKRLHSQIKSVFVDMGIDSLTPKEKERKIEALMEQKNIRIEISHDAPDFNLLELSQTVLELTEINLQGLLGNLNIMSKAIQVLEWKKI